MKKYMFLLLSAALMSACGSEPQSPSSMTNGPYDDEPSSSGGHANGQTDQTGQDKPGSTGTAETGTNPSSGEGEVAVATSPLCEEQQIVCPQGEPGTPGAVGAKGETGQQGPQGLPGEAGQQGPQGLQGEQGPVGPMGPIGSRGPAGADGSQGQQGAQGAQGSQGPQGQQGVQGIQGQQGTQGVKGDPGTSGLFTQGSLYFRTQQGGCISSTTTCQSTSTNKVVEAYATCDPGDLAISGSCFGGTNITGVGTPLLGIAGVSPMPDALDWVGAWPISYHCVWSMSAASTAAYARVNCLKAQ